MGVLCQRGRRRRGGEEEEKVNKEDLKKRPREVKKCVCEREREREREKDGERDRKRERESERERDIYLKAYIKEISDVFPFSS